MLVLNELVWDKHGKHTVGAGVTDVEVEKK